MPIYIQGGPKLGIQYIAYKLLYTPVWPTLLNQHMVQERLYTWKALGDKSRRQLDYILVKHRFRNSVKDVQTLPVADTDSDHNLLVAKICTKLKKNYKIPKEKTTLGFAEIICSMTMSAGYSRRETRCNWM